MYIRLNKPLYVQAPPVHLLFLISNEGGDKQGPFCEPLRGTPKAPVEPGGSYEAALRAYYI